MSKANKLRNRPRLCSALGACALAIFLAGQLRGDDEVGGIFAKANEIAQARCVKIFGAAIGRVEGYGTGIIVSEEGHILTTSGVMLSGQRIYVVTPDGERHLAKVVRRSQDLQCALLQLQGNTQDGIVKTPNYFKLQAELKAKKGDWVLSVSNLFKVADGREKLSVNLGIISLRTSVDTKRGTQQVPYKGEVLLIDAITSNPGAGGGAVVDVEGNLVGMVGRILESADTRTRLNFAVPADLLLKFYTGQPIDSEEPVAKVPLEGKPYLGIRVFSLGVGSKALAYVDRVTPGSPAHKAGIRSDDLIVAIGPQTVHDIAEYKKILATLTPGEEIVLLVKRKNDLLELSVTPKLKEDK